MNTQQTKSLLQTIRSHRSNESNFTKLATALDQAIDQAGNNPKLKQALQDIKQKQVVAYTEAKETGGTAWPEFENFITQLERTLTETLREQET